MMSKEKMKIILAKLKYLSFFIFLVVLPWQKRHIFSSDLIAGEFNEWTAISLYLSDIIFGIALLFWLGELFLLKKTEQRKSRTRDGGLRIVGYWLLAGLVLWSLLSVPQSPNLKAALYRLLKLLETILLFVFVVKNFAKQKPRFLAYLSLIFSGLIQGTIAASQYWKQRSLGLKIFGETDLSPELVGVAKIVVQGQKIIRSYGTLPHPNLLAGFLIFVIPLCFLLYQKIFRPSQKSSLQKLFLKSGLILAVLFFVFVLILTFSRTAWFGFAIILALLLIYIFKNSLLKNYFPLLAGLLIAIIILSILFWPELATRSRVTDSPDSDFALSNRILLNKLGLLIIFKNPLLGIGTGNFVPALSSYLSFDFPGWRFQPVHNIYLAYAAEIGLPGLLIFLTFLYLTFYLKFKISENKLESLTLSAVLIAYCLIGLFDHYFYDLQQGILIFWLVLGFIWTLTSLQDGKYNV